MFIVIKLCKIKIYFYSKYLFLNYYNSFNIKMLNIFITKITF